MWSEWTDWTSVKLQTGNARLHYVDLHEKAGGSRKVEVEVIIGEIPASTFPSATAYGYMSHGELSVGNWSQPLHIKEGETIWVRFRAEADVEIDVRLTAE